MTRVILENFEINEVKPGQFQKFKNREGDLSKKMPEPNMWLLINHTKPTNTLYWNYYLLTADNYK